MIFQELVLQNIGPYQGRQTINLSPDAGDGPRPIILLGGMNGGGKTTLMDAIRLALYGYRAQCSTRGNLSYGEFLTQSVNRHAKGRACVELAFQLTLDNEPTELRVRRFWDKNPKRGKDNLIVMRRNDLESWQDTHLTNTWDERIEEILPLGISSLFLFDGEQVKELAEQELPTQIVVDAIRSLLGLELASRLAIDLDVLIYRKKKENAGSKELQDIEDIEQELNRKQDELSIVRQRLAKLESDKDFSKEQWRIAEEKFISEGGSFASDLPQINMKINQLEKDINAHRIHLTELAADCLPLLLIEDLLGQAYNQAKEEKQQQQAKISYEILAKRDYKLLTLIKDLSPPSDFLEHIKCFLETENKILLNEAHSNDMWLDLDTELTELLGQLLTYRLPQLSKASHDCLEKLQYLSSEKESLEKLVAAAAPEERFEYLNEERRKKQAEFLLIEQDYDKAEQLYKQHGQEVEAIKKKLAKYTDEKIEQQASEHLISAAIKTQKTLSMFSEKLTIRKLNQLELEVTECYLYLLHKSDLIHRIAIDTATFALSLYDSTGLQVPKHRLSAGEKQLLAIALLWGLARASGRNLPVAIDTPLGRLDSSHRANLVERYFPSASQQVILLSTDTEITQTEVERLRQVQAIGREYRLLYDPVTTQTVVQDGYFW